MKIIAEYEVPRHLFDQALNAQEDGDMSWLYEIATSCIDFTARVVDE